MQEVVFPSFVKVGELRSYNLHLDEDNHMQEKTELLLVFLVMMSLLKRVTLGDVGGVVFKFGMSTNPSVLATTGVFQGIGEILVIGGLEALGLRNYSSQH